MDISILILAMAAVTFIPRVLPAVILSKVKLNKKTEEFLSYIPYTAVTALVFPGVVTMDETNFSVGVVGAVTASLLAWRNASVMTVVLGSVLIVLMTYSFFDLASL